MPTAACLLIKTENRQTGRTARFTDMSANSKGPARRKQTNNISDKNHPRLQFPKIYA